jgi:DNA recombination protein RmuC
MVVCLPNSRRVVVDAKTPLDAYLEAIEADNDDGRNSAFKKHARHVRERYKELAAKAYWTSFPFTPEFVVLFLPGEPFLAAALKEDPGLLDDALNDKVVLATPATLFCLLSAVRYGWQEQRLTENARHISVLGREMHDRIADWSSHLFEVGDALKKAVGAYNDSIGSLESRVMVSARRLKEMGISSEKDLPEFSPMDLSVRELKQQ